MAPTIAKEAENANSHNFYMKHAGEYQKYISLVGGVQWSMQQETALFSTSGVCYPVCFGL